MVRDSTILHEYQLAKKTFNKFTSFSFDQSCSHYDHVLNSSLNSVLTFLSVFAKMSLVKIPAKRNSENKGNEKQ